MKRKHLLNWLPLLLLCIGCNTTEEKKEKEISGLRVAEGKRYFETLDGASFFWLGDTGWLLFVKLDRKDAADYLETRRQQGFNVIQVMVLHDLKKAVNVYGDSAIVAQEINKPLVTEGNNPEDSLQYDFWDHVEYMVDLAAEKGMYMALVPVWGTNVKKGWVSPEKGREYAGFLTERFGKKKNIIWLNGGDIKGSDSLTVWNVIGETLKEKSPGQLVTFHPRGRTTSSQWFHNAPWLDFNMSQSGHRRYDQDTSAGDLHFGEDNWRYIRKDIALSPAKPTLDGEPSYEGIPHGLHDTTQPYWNEHDLRRYAWWSVLEGAAGFTYGHSAVMQFFHKGDDGSAYGAKVFWNEAMKTPGAEQMRHVKELMLSRSLNGFSSGEKLVLNQGEKYERLAAGMGKNYAYVYTYTGRNMRINTELFTGKKLKASWFDPRNGTITAIGVIENTGSNEFDPPGEPAPANDWILILEAV